MQRGRRGRLLSSLSHTQMEICVSLTLSIFCSLSPFKRFSLLVFSCWWDCTPIVIRQDNNKERLDLTGTRTAFAVKTRPCKAPVLVIVIESQLQQNHKYQATAQYQYLTAS